MFECALIYLKLLQSIHDLVRIIANERSMASITSTAIERFQINYFTWLVSHKTILRNLPIGHITFLSDISLRNLGLAAVLHSRFHWLINVLMSYFVLDSF